MVPALTELTAQVGRGRGEPITLGDKGIQGTYSGLGQGGVVRQGCSEEATGRWLSALKGDRS